MTAPNIASADGQAGGCELGECHRRLLLTGDFCPCLYHVHIAVSTVIECDSERIYGILHADGGDGGMSLGACRDALDSQIGSQVAVGMTDGQSCLTLRIESVSGVGIHATVVGE